MIRIKDAMKAVASGHLTNEGLVDKNGRTICRLVTKNYNRFYGKMRRKVKVK